MSKSFSYPNKGTCSKETHIVLNDDHTIESIEVIGGCNGNLKGISRLLKGMKAEDAIARMEGTTCAPAPPAALTRSPRTSSALWLSCKSQSVQKDRRPALISCGQNGGLFCLSQFSKIVPIETASLR